MSPVWKERAIASALGVFVALLAWLGGNSAIFPPELWDKVCVASGIRPPPSAIPGLWTCLASGLFGAFGISKGILILRFLGFGDYLIGAKLFSLLTGHLGVVVKSSLSLALFLRALTLTRAYRL